MGCLNIDLKWITRIPRLVDGIRVKHYCPRTEQGYPDWIKRFIHFHGKRPPPEFETSLCTQNECLIDRSRPTSTSLCLQWSAVRYGRRWPFSDRRTGRSRLACQACTAVTFIPDRCTDP